MADSDLHFRGDSGACSILFAGLALAKDTGRAFRGNGIIALLRFPSAHDVSEVSPYKPRPESGIDIAGCWNTAADNRIIQVIEWQKTSTCRQREQTRWKHTIS